LQFSSFFAEIWPNEVVNFKKKLFVKIGSNLDQKWQNSKIVCKFENFEKNLKFWPYKDLNSIEIDCCTSKKSWLVKPPNFIKSHFFWCKKKIEKKNSKKWPNFLKISDFGWKKLFVGSNFNPIYFCEFVCEFNSEYIKMLGMYTIIGYQNLFFDTCLFSTKKMKDYFFNFCSKFLSTRGQNWTKLV